MSERARACVAVVVVAVGLVLIWVDIIERVGGMERLILDT